jgi:3-hydroxybutyryl-CoA dehydrogenase
MPGLENQARKDWVGVVGAGTMGAGIALVALLADFRVILYDVQKESLSKAGGYIEKHLQHKQRSINLKYLTTTSVLEDLQGCGYVIEAAPEDLSLKKDLFSKLGEICRPPAILASNTSTLPVTAIAAAAKNPGRVAGLHFFNPAPLLPLVEVIRAAETDLETIEELKNLAKKLGKTPVVAGDTPGFIVNRVARPFYGEALRLLGEGAASHVEIDRIIRGAASFKMGPFELMDLIGIDVNFAATRSMFDQTFGEPRYRPHHIQAQMVQQGALGRKTGRGFYRYDQDGQHQEDPQRRKSTRQSQQQEFTVILSEGSWAPGLEQSIKEAGVSIEPLQGSDRIYNQTTSSAIVAAGPEEGMQELLIRMDRELPTDTLILCQAASTPLSAAASWIQYSHRLVGFDGLFSSGSVLTLTASSKLGEGAHATAEHWAHMLGKEPIWVEDTPGLVATRIVCMLANEAAFAVGERVAAPETIDRAMQLGTNYPKGPLAWAGEIGYDRVLTVLANLQNEYGEERFRPAPLLRRWARQQF